VDTPLLQWLIPALSVIGIIFVVRRLLPNKKKLAAATNALLAEYDIGLIELIPANPFAQELKNAIATVWQVSGFPSTSREEALRDFDSRSRFIQLNIIAMALETMGHQPMLPGEAWQYVRNPFVGGLEDPRYVDLAAGMIKKDHGVDIQISNESLNTSLW